MSKFATKLFQNQIPTEEDWTEHLIEAHKIAPSMTPQGFAPYKTSDGINSYQVLAQSLGIATRGDKIILDLACGDGFLLQYLLPKLSKNSKIIGIDMSDCELSIAKQTYKDPQIFFHNAKAQSIPLEASCVDLVLCHMAFMLMLPVESVVIELARILKPKAVFSAVIGNRKSQGIFTEIQQFSFRFLDSRYPKIKETKSGDSGVQTEDGLKQLFSPGRGFTGAVEIEEFELAVKMAHTGVWDFMKDMYFIGLLPDDEKSQLRDELTSFAATKCDSSGNIAFGFPMKKFTVSKI